MFAQRLKYSFVNKLRTACLALFPSLLLVGCASVGPRTPAPEGVLSPSTNSFNFNTVVIGKSATQTLHLTNTGTAPLTLESLTLKSQQFAATGPSLPRTILPLQTVTYSISFSPTTSGNVAASLEFTTNLSTVPTSVSLAGVAQKAFAVLEVSPSSISFGNTKLQNKGAQNVTLKNTGDINMTVSGITIAGAGFGYSDISPGFSLSPNQTITFQIWFRPQTAGKASGTVTILSANIASPEEIPVSGEGVNPNNPTPPPSAPPPARVAHSVALSWQASPSVVSRYHVYRSTTSGSGFSLLATTTGAISFTDDSVTDGTTYYYVVTAVDSHGNESAYSNQVTAAIPSS